MIICCYQKHQAYDLVKCRNYPFKYSCTAPGCKDVEEFSRNKNKEFIYLYFD